MDYVFPRELFSSSYKCGPPERQWTHCGGSWGSYDGLKAERDSGRLTSCKFTPKHHAQGEIWRHTELAPLPLLPPKEAFPSLKKPPDPIEFTEHMENFYTDHSHDAFGCMSELLSENFHFGKSKKKKHKEKVNMWKVKNYIKSLDIKRCHRKYQSLALDGYSALLSDVVHSVPPELLGSLLYEELTEQRQRMLSSEEATGGALDFVPSAQGDSGCLIYAGNKGQNQLNFHKVELQHHRGASSALTASSAEPFRVNLKCPIRQISTASLFNTSCVAVRSDWLCGVWKFSEGDDPHLLQVVNTTEVASCVSVSPHVLGEVLVASESGTVNLWTVGKRIQKVREEDTNLYFNAKSSWRWCEFSAHPRVLLYADRTGVELTDIRSNPVRAHTLFRISNTSNCRSGERLILSSYLGNVHPFHHLITTQFSAYIMDERFPCVPMLKWDHMMESPPLFCHVLPGSASSGSMANGAGTTKLVLGSSSSQEITMLQYSGGRVEACSSRGPPQALLRPKDSVKLFPMQIPHRQEITINRLSSPAAGLTCVQKIRGDPCICVVQLTEAADIFYQILEPENQHTTSHAQTVTTPVREIPEELVPDSQAFTSDLPSDEEMVGPTQAARSRFVAETPEREQPSDSEDSETEARSRRLKLLGLEIVVNDEDNVGSDEDSGTEEKSRRPERLGLEVTVNDEMEDEAAPAADAAPAVDAAPAAGVAEQTFKRSVQVKLTGDALVTWKHWIQKLLKKCGEEKSRPRVQVSNIKPSQILRLPKDAAPDPSEAELIGRLRRDLRVCMAERSLLLPHTLADTLGTPDVVPLPNPVDPDAYTDDLSQRLTVSWEGVEHWEAWWEDKLGLNRDDKVRALRRKRKREKDARRASGQQVALSGSFCSSISYQSNLDSFSDTTGWSSAASQGAWSSSEGLGPLSRIDRDFSQSQGPTPTATPTKVQQMDPPTPSSAKRDASPPVSQRSQHPADAVATPHPQDEGSSTQAPPLRLQRELRVDVSGDVFAMSGLSQSQSSQGRAPMSQSSQASQAKRKKSRMGF